MNRTQASFPLLFVLLSLPAPAQDLRWTKTGSYDTQSFGRSSSSLADTNGDGYRDILIGDPHAEPGGQQRGQVHLVSGLDGSTLHTIQGANPSSRMGYDVLGIQDVSGDGIEDYVVTFDADYPQVRSGSDGSLIRTLSVFSVPGEQIVESLEDVDGDGWRELIVGHPDFGSNHGQVLLVRGSYVATGAGPSLLWTRSGIQALGFLGSEVANAGDVDGDGVEDVVAGAPVETGPGGECGIVYLLSGTSGAVIHALTLSTSCVGFGSQLDTAGDWNGDGFADVVIGTHDDATGGNSAGAVRIYSGASGDVLHSVFGTPFDRFGRSVLGGIDVDGDGREEVLFGAYTDPCASGRGTVRGLDPLGAAVQFTLCGPSDGNLYGSGLQAVGDVDGDGQQDFVVHDPEIEPSLDSRVYLYGGHCLGSITRYCPATTNSSGLSATITATGSQSISANDMGLQARSCPPNQTGLFFYGRNQIMIFAGDGWRCVGGQTFRLLPVTQISASGIAQRALDFTVAPLGNGAGKVLPGSIWNFQFWFRDPMGAGGAFNYSDALSIRFCP